MAKSQELFEQIKELFTEFETEHNGSSKAAKSRARKKHLWRKTNKGYKI